MVALNYSFIETRYRKYVYFQLKWLQSNCLADLKTYLNSIVTSLCIPLVSLLKIVRINFKKIFTW